MKHCTKCVMPDTKPGLVLDSEGVCQACRHAERKKNEIDWDGRWKELEKLCDKYRNCNGDYYDCIVPGSGGKDSLFAVYIMKKKLDMNPLLLNIANFTWTKAGIHNFKNWNEAFNCDVISLNIARETAKIFSRKSFERLGQLYWYWDAAIYTWVLQMAAKLRIPFLIYGEDASVEYGGVQKEDKASAKDIIFNDVCRDLPKGIESWLGDGIEKKDLNPLMHPTVEELDTIEPIYLSYFIPWSFENSYKIATEYGFKALGDEWKREGFVEDYGQIDAIGYLVDSWLRYPKMGYAQVTNVCGFWIRDGKITREDAVKLVRENDHKLDPLALEDYLEFSGYTKKQFIDIVERFYNREIFDKVNGVWKLKNPVWKS